MEHIKKFNESNSTGLTKEEFQDIVDALRDAKDLVEDILLGEIVDEEKAEIAGELVNHALGIMERLGSER